MSNCNIEANKVEPMKNKRYHKELRKQGIKNFKRVLMLKCHVCGKYENKTLMLHSDEPGYFVGAETAAYLNCMRWVRNRKGKQRIDVGDIRYAIVWFPICCKIGDEFTVVDNEFEEYGEEMYFATLKLLKIKRHFGRSAIVKEILSLGNYFSFVKTISEDQKVHIAQMDYEYKLGNNDCVELRYVGKHKLYAVCCQYGGGDERYEDLIYTDNNGIDHLVYSSYESFHTAQCFLGDKILGLHKFSPFCEFE